MLDPNLSGHIDVDMLEEWWPHTKFAAPDFENVWMKQIHLETLRSKIAMETMERVFQEQADEARVAAKQAAVESEKQQRLALQPKRGAALLSRSAAEQHSIQTQVGCSKRFLL